MTDAPQLAPTDLPAAAEPIDSLGASVRAANAAARSAGVVVRAVTELAELASIAQLFEEIWRPDSNPPLGTEMLRALSKAGNYVVGALDGEKLVGACVGFFAAPQAEVLHSHIAGVSSTALGRHVGYALKLHQRAWALGHGIRRIEWTFDPLVARNAYFNVVKLGGWPAEYLPNFYGGMRDGINGIDDTDRLLLHWNLRDPRVDEACAGRWRAADLGALRERGAVVALDRGPDGAPVEGADRAGISLVAVPRDIEALRITDPVAAARWRSAVREVLGGLLSTGARITDFGRGGWYVTETPETPETPERFRATPDSRPNP